MPLGFQVDGLLKLYALLGIESVSFVLVEARAIRPLLPLQKTLISIRFVPCFRFPFLPEGVTYSEDRMSGAGHGRHMILIVRMKGVYTSVFPCLLYVWGAADWVGGSACVVIPSHPCGVALCSVGMDSL